MTAQTTNAYVLGDRRIKNLGDAQVYHECTVCHAPAAPYYVQQTLHRNGWAWLDAGHLECLRTDQWVSAPID